MFLSLDWQEMALRLFFTVLAGALVGINRGEHGHPAGLRTTLLVCLAASLSMIETNLLLGSSGKTPNSFAVLDLMRLPLGILSGMGFIGAGAILRKGNRVQGVTTAATLWFVTMLGLCFGGGQIGLGCAGLALGLGTLTLLKKCEQHWNSDRKGVLTVAVEEKPFPEGEIAARLQAHGYRLISWKSVAFDTRDQARQASCLVHWQAPRMEAESMPPFCGEMAALPGVVKVEWRE